MISRLDLFVELLELEGGYSNLDGDRGGRTMFGVASNFWPEEFERLTQLNWPLDEVFMFYQTNFMEVFPLFEEIRQKDGYVTRLLFFGRVHGSGVRDYTQLVQQFIVSRGTKIAVDRDWGPITSREFLNLSDREQTHLHRYILQQKRWLQERRVRSVGISAYARGISNRVSKELSRNRRLLA